MKREKKSGRGFLALLAGYGAWRLGELWLSRRHERALGDRVPRQPERGFGVMVAAHLVPFVLGPLEARRRTPPLALQITSAALLGGAGLLRLWALRSLGESWSVRVRASGEMPISDRGPYRLVRHPNYSAVIVELAALPLAGGCYLTAALASLLNAVALALRIGDEERALGASADWRAKMEHKPRFVPTLH